MAIYIRLGCLFLDFKGKPAPCALFFVVKLCKSLVKGTLVGVFYGEPSCMHAPPQLHAYMRHLSCMHAPSQRIHRGTTCQPP
jgi:hypothetical protein